MSQLCEHRLRSSLSLFIVADPANLLQLSLVNNHLFLHAIYPCYRYILVDSKLNIGGPVIEAQRLFSQLVQRTVMSGTFSLSIPRLFNYRYSSALQLSNNALPDLFDCRGVRWLYLLYQDCCATCFLLTLGHWRFVIIRVSPALKYFS